MDRTQTPVTTASADSLDLHDVVVDVAQGGDDSADPIVPTAVLNVDILRLMRVGAHAEIGVVTMHVGALTLRQSVAAIQSECRVHVHVPAHGEKDEGLRRTVASICKQSLDGDSFMSMVWIDGACTETGAELPGNVRMFKTVMRLFGGTAGQADDAAANALRILQPAAAQGRQELVFLHVTQHQPDQRGRRHMFFVLAALNRGKAGVQLAYYELLKAMGPWAWPDAAVLIDSDTALEGSDSLLTLVRSYRDSVVAKLKSTMPTRDLLAEREAQRKTYELADASLLRDARSRVTQLALQFTRVADIAREFLVDLGLIFAEEVWTRFLTSYFDRVQAAMTPKDGTSLSLTDVANFEVLFRVIKRAVVVIERNLVAGVAGRVKVVETGKARGILSWAQSFEFTNGQTLSKAAESWLDSVTCVSGCCALISISAVMHGEIQAQLCVRPSALLDQSRMTLGEDRNLSCLFLLKGWSTLYEPNVTCSSRLHSDVYNWLAQRRRWDCSALSVIIFEVKAAFKCWRNIIGIPKEDPKKPLPSRPDFGDEPKRATAARSAAARDLFRGDELQQETAAAFHAVVHELFRGDEQQQDAAASLPAAVRKLFLVYEKSAPTTFERKPLSTDEQQADAAERKPFPADDNQTDAAVAHERKPDHDQTDAAVAHERKRVPADDNQTDAETDASAAGSLQRKPFPCTAESATAARKLFAAPPSGSPGARSFAVRSTPPLNRAKSLALLTGNKHAPHLRPRIRAGTRCVIGLAMVDSLVAQVAPALITLVLFNWLANIVANPAAVLAVQVLFGALTLGFALMITLRPVKKRATFALMIMHATNALSVMSFVAFVWDIVQLLVDNCGLSDALHQGTCNRVLSSAVAFIVTVSASLLTALLDTNARNTCYNVRSICAGGVSFMLLMPLYMFGLRLYACGNMGNVTWGSRPSATRSEPARKRCLGVALVLGLYLVNVAVVLLVRLFNIGDYAGLLFAGTMCASTVLKFAQAVLFYQRKRCRAWRARRPRPSQAAPKSAPSASNNSTPSADEKTIASCV